MRDDHTRELLHRLTRVTPPPEAEATALQRMLDSFDETARPDLAAKPQRAWQRPQENARSYNDGIEIVEDLQVQGARAPDAGSSRWRPLLAAAAVLVLIVAGAGLFRLWASTDDGDLVTTASAIDDDALDSSADATAAQLALPTEIVGEFSTTVAGVVVSFATAESLWLTESSPNLLRLAVDPNDPDSPRLLVAVPGGPVEAVGEDLATYLRGGGPGVSGSVTPLTVDGVNSLYWRGVLTDLQRESCPIGAEEPCVVLYQEPLPIGFDRTTVSVNLDVVALPIDGQRDLVLIAHLPTTSFTFDPLGPFAQLLDSLSVSDTSG